MAGPSTEPLLPVESASLPKIVVPELLDPQAEPELTAPGATTESSDDQATGDSQEIAVPNGDLSSMVAQLKSSDPGSRELDCLATGIYFEAKSEPLAGQLAVGKVIANRAQSGGRFPST
jgi:spore germination cell wall hydrolase CwlJ-like protein